MNVYHGTCETAWAQKQNNGKSTTLFLSGDRTVAYQYAKEKAEQPIVIKFNLRNIPATIKISFISSWDEIFTFEGDIDSIKFLAEKD